MSQLTRGQVDESDQAAATHSRPQESSKTSQHMSSHDQLCDSMHEKVLNSELATRNISSLTLQEGRRCLSMQERSTKSHNPSANRED